MLVKQCHDPLNKFMVSIPIKMLNLGMVAALRKLPPWLGTLNWNLGMLGFWIRSAWILSIRPGCGSLDFIEVLNSSFSNTCNEFYPFLQRARLIFSWARVSEAAPSTQISCNLPQINCISFNVMSLNVMQCNVMSCIHMFFRYTYIYI